MMKRKQEQLIHYLLAKSDYTSVRELSNYLSVSERQVKNYVSQINSKKRIIISSRKGYKIEENVIIDKCNDGEELDRTNLVLQKLITNKDGYDFYDLASDLYISESSLNNELNKVKEILAKFKIDLIKQKSTLLLAGSENNMRKLMYYLISKTNMTGEIYNVHSFSLISKKEDMYELICDMKRIISEYFDINDFQVHNLALHFMIIIERLKCGYSIDNNIDEGCVNQKYLKIADKLNYYSQQHFNIQLNKKEQLNIALVVANNVNQANIKDYDEITINNLDVYVNKKYIEITKDLLTCVEENYYLPPFKEKFIATFTLHIQNLFFRAENNCYAKNPLTAKIKLSYPLVFDIASFIASRLKTKYSLLLNEDEITFISFHIGSYFEENSFINKTKVNCAFIYSDYYDFYKITLNKIETKFENMLNIVYVCPTYAFDYKNHKEKIDLVLSSSISNPPEIPSEKIIYIKPFMNSEDYEDICLEIKSIFIKKNKKELNEYILSFFNEKLFYVSPKCKNKGELIRMMCNDLVYHKYADDVIYKDIMDRENISSTAFNDVAIPHSFTNNGIYKSFISICLFPEEYDWGDGSKVKMVVMVGIGNNSRNIFSSFFEQIIQMLDNPQNVAKILVCENFKEFYHTIKLIMDHI